MRLLRKGRRSFLAASACTLIRTVLWLSPKNQHVQSELPRNVGPEGFANVHRHEGPGQSLVERFILPTGSSARDERPRFFLSGFVEVKVFIQKLSRQIAVVVCLIIITSLALTSGMASAQGHTTHAESLAAWDKVATVLQHPRCLNCHQLTSPLQGDKRRPHIPQVVRGKDSHGIGAMLCGNCHNDMGNNLTSRTPGGQHWQLAPVSMLWQGLSRGDLCRSLKDPAKNGKRGGAALIEHMETEPLVLYGWNPGKSLQPVPMSHNDFVAATKVWVAGGMACPK